MRTALLIATLTTLAATPAMAHGATYQLRLTGTQTVTTGGTGTLTDPAGCSYSRNETSSARYVLRSSTIRVRVRGNRPAQSLARAALAITGSGRLDQTTSAAAGCPAFPAVNESCGARANTLGGVRVTVRLTGPRRTAVGFFFQPATAGGAIFGGFGTECGLLAAHAGLTSPTATLDEPISFAGLFRRSRTVVVGSEQVLTFVNLFTGEIQEVTCDQCVERRSTTRWTMTFQRAK